MVELHGQSSSTMILELYSHSLQIFISSMQTKVYSSETKATVTLQFLPRRMVEAIGQECRRQTCLQDFPMKRVMFIRQKGWAIHSGQSAPPDVSGKPPTKVCIGMLI